jgi:hypothetical protein
MQGEDIPIADKIAILRIVSKARTLDGKAKIDPYALDHTLKTTGDSMLDRYRKRMGGFGTLLEVLAREGSLQKVGGGFMMTDLGWTNLKTKYGTYSEDVGDVPV